LAGATAKANFLKKIETESATRRGTPTRGAATRALANWRSKLFEAQQKKII